MNLEQNEDEDDDDQDLRLDNEDDDDDDEGIPDDAEDPEDLRNDDPDFEEDDILGDQDRVNNQNVAEMNDELVERIEQEAEMNRRAREYMEKIEGRRPKRGDISMNILIVL